MMPSMSGKGKCFNNAAAAIFQYVNGFYNPRWRHSYLGNISPLAFEAKAANKIAYRHKTVTSPHKPEPRADQGERPQNLQFGKKLQADRQDYGGETAVFQHQRKQADFCSSSG